MLRRVLIAAALVAPLVSQSARAAPPSLLTFEEQFGNNSRGWVVGDDERGRVAVEGGRLVIECKTTESAKYSAAHAPIDPDQDFRIEVQIYKINGEDNRGYGLVFGARGSQDQNRFLVAGDGHYQLGVCEAGKVRDMIPWTMSNAVRKGNTWNTLVVEKRDGKLHLIINGEEIDSSRMPDHWGPEVGAINTLPGRVEVTRIRVWQGNSPAPPKPEVEVARPVVEPQKVVDAKPVDAKPADAKKSGLPHIVAVFNFEDGSGKMNKTTLLQLADYLATLLTKKGYSVVPREQLRKQLGETKKDSYRACFDTACQIELGKALAAEGTVSTKVLKVGTECVVTSNLFDLKTETTVRAASVETTCGDTQLLKSMQKLVDQF